MCQLAARGLWVEQITEVLEFVQDDQVGLQRIQTCVGEEPPKFAYEPLTLPPSLIV